MNVQKQKIQIKDAFVFCCYLENLKDSVYLFPLSRSYLFHPWAITYYSVLSWSQVSVFLNVPDETIRQFPKVTGQPNCVLCFGVSVFLCVSPYKTIRQFLKVTGQPLTPGETQEIDPLPFVNYKYDTVCLGNMIQIRYSRSGKEFRPE